MHFRESTVWRCSMELARETCRLSWRLPAGQAGEIRRHLLHAVTLVPCCIAEGWSEELETEKLRYLSAARRALARSETLLIFCEDMGWVTSHETGHLRNLITDILRRLRTLQQNFPSPK